MRIVLATFAVAAKRLWSNRWLAAAGALGFLAAAALAFTLPLYADSVYQRILDREMRTNRTSLIRPLSFTFDYNRWGEYAEADRVLDVLVPVMVEMTRRDFMRYFQTSSLRLYPSEAVTDTHPGPPIVWSPVVAIDHFADHINLVDGQMPGPIRNPGAGPGGTLPRVEAIVSAPLAKALGMYVGRDYLAISPRSSDVRLPIVITGIWEPRDTYDPYLRFFQPDVLDRMIFVSPETFIQLAPNLQRELTKVMWYMDFESPEAIRVWDVQPFIDRIDRLMAQIKALGHDVSLGLSPADRLKAYQRESRQLATQLYAFGIPVFVLVFGFIILVAGVMANSRRAEIAVMRSRGATAWQVLGISLIETLILAATSTALAIPAAMGIAQAVGQTRSFLVFVSDQMLPVLFTAAAWPFGLLVLAFAVVVTVLPNVGAARHTIISYKLERARAMRPAWWQRAGLDVLLLIPAAYWTYLLQRQGTVDLAGLGDSGDPFSNPSLFLLPALSIFALTLVYIRLVPLFVRALAWLCNRLPGTTLVMATKQLARSPSAYTTPIFLLTMTLAMATFTASAAATLDAFLEQQARYDLGSDVRLYKTGEDRQAGWAVGGAASLPSLGSVNPTIDDAGSSGSNAAVELDLGPRYSFLPLSDYRELPGVESATRVGTYPCTIRLAGGGDVSCTFVGVDRADYPSVAFWRRDFASDSLGSLMNALGTTRDGVLLPESVMAERGLQPGDLVQATVYVGTGRQSVIFTAVDSFKLWPGWYPDRPGSGVYLIGNLDYLFEEVGGQYPYDIWMKARSGANPSEIVAEARQVDKQINSAKDVRTQVENETTRPQRQGLFGMLSIGFLAAAAFTVLGFTLYAVFSLRRRFIELGVLRAVGLSILQMSAFLAVEMALLLGAGTVGGTALGVLASEVYIPYLRAAATRALPFPVVIDWTQVYLVYALFGLIFVIALVALVAYVRRLRIFQAVKLGETE